MTLFFSKHQTFLSLLFVITVTNALQSVVGSFLTPYLLSISISSTWIGVLHGIFRVSSLAFILPSGIFTDRIKVRPLLLLGSFATILFFFGLKITTSPLILSFLFFLGGAGTTVLVIASTALFYKNLGSKKEKKGAILAVMTSFVNGVFILVGGVVITALSFQSVFTMAIVVSAFFLFFLVFIPTNETYQLQKEDYFHELQRKEVIFLLLFCGLYMFHAGGDSVSIPAIWKQELSFSSYQIGLLMGIPILVTGTLGIGLLSFITKGKPSFARFFVLGGCFLTGLGHLFLAFGQTFDQAMIGRFVHITGDNVMGFFLTIEIAFLFSKKSIGGNFGLANLLITIVSTISVIIAGIVGNYFPHQYFLYLSAGVCMLGALWSLFWRVEFRRE